MGGETAIGEHMMTFGQRVREQRRLAGLTQEALAERAGVSPRSISEWERDGAHVPRRDTVALLARAFNLAGAERSAFEALVQRSRRARAGADRSMRPVPPSVAARPAGPSIPRALTSFVGRERELRELGQMLPTAPLLSIVGSGGVGKTRLAHEVLRSHAMAYADGSWLVELAGLDDAALVAHAVAAAVGLDDLKPRHVLDALVAFLRDKHALLALDNCEHLIDPSAALVRHLLRICPRLHVLVTSREPLSIDGETIWRLAPLEVPDVTHAPSAEQIAHTAAVRLFLERARAVDQRLEISEANAAVLARICAAVAGLPLALELAAARVGVLSLEQLADRLSRDPGGLGNPTRPHLPQHRTVRATIDWSHDLLDEHEQVLLRRLAVFAGGWTLRSAEAVCSGMGLEAVDVLDLLGHLVDKSMVVVETDGRVARYRLLEPIRQYALERLEAAQEASVVRARHAAVIFDLAHSCAAIGGSAAHADDGDDEIAALDRLECEHDNLRAALRWALGHQHGDEALRAAAALCVFWERRGHFQEGCAWLEEALAVAGGTSTARARSMALNALGGLYWRGGDVARAQAISQQALLASRQAGDAVMEAWALGNLGASAYFAERPGQAVDWLERSVALGRQVGHPALLSVGLSLLARARLGLEGADEPAVAVLLDEAVRRAEAAGSRYALGYALTAKGDLLWRQGRTGGAIAAWRRALRERAALADRRGVAGCLERLAWGLSAGEHFAFAACAFGAAETQHRLLGVALRHDQWLDHSERLGAVRHHLSDETFAASWSAGQSDDLQDMVRRVLDWTVADC